MRCSRLDTKSIFRNDREGSRPLGAQGLNDLASTLSHLTIIPTARALGREVAPLGNPIRIWFSCIYWARIHIVWVGGQRGSSGAVFNRCMGVRSLDAEHFKLRKISPPSA